MRKGQVLIEFTFCMIIVFLMIYAIMKIVQWTGLDLVNRRAAHDNVLTMNVVESYGDITAGPMRQVDPYFYSPAKMNAVWDGS